MDGSDPSGLDWLNDQANFWGGGGAGIAGPIPQYLSDKLGEALGIGDTDDMVDKCSSAYQGGMFGGMIFGTTFGDDEGALLGGGEELAQLSKFDQYMEKVKTLDVATKENGAVFWSGPGNKEIAEAFAESEGRQTLEMTPGGSWLQDEKLFDQPGELTQDQAGEIWDALSQRFADGASGNAVGFVNGARPDSTFNRIEFSALKLNAKITNVLTGGF